MFLEYSSHVSTIFYKSWKHRLDNSKDIDERVTTCLNYSSPIVFDRTEERHCNRYLYLIRDLSELHQIVVLYGGPVASIYV